MGPDAEALAVEIWRRMFPRVDSIKDRLEGYVGTAEFRSSLRLDDRYLGWWRGGGLHMSAAQTATDALMTVRSILEPVADRTAPLPMVSLAPLLRAAIEGGSLVIYLLAPDGRDSRLGRSYAVAVEDAKYHGGFLGTIGRPDNTLEGDAKEHVRSLVDMRPTLGPSAGFTFPRVQYSDVVKVADVVLAANAPPARTGRLLGWWQILSGLSHGKQWAFVESMNRRNSVPDDEDQSAVLQMTATPASIALALQLAVETMDNALRLYELRSRAANAQEEDAAEPDPVPYAQLTDSVGHEPDTDREG